ncbi:AmpG family muropeptide MFS transporter [Roseomonas fluvialis]|uniref:Integral membrane signal transducer protein n=1 Tax=Roseomonas fluvialis TaxID=1750527 RepID=A0ABN6NWG0_9PROT|nr:MFS transporter [Roseomonas fluvialis]BDG70380.1 integral membrane signal transducer protein [Roseomonas fluvialis]
MDDSRFSRWADRRLLVMLALGFAAAVPLPLVAGQVLRQWFVESGMSLAEIGLTALIGLAYANKFLWAPALDAVRPPVLGRRRGWLLLLQVALVATIAALAATDPAGGATMTVVLAVVVAFLSASQDIVIDAWRIEMMETSERDQAWGLTAYVWGYRAGLLASGAGTLLLVGHVGWHMAYGVAASLMLVGIVATLAGREPPAPVVAPVGWRARMRLSVVGPFIDFTGRRYWLAILAFVALFKLGEALAGIMVTPFYRSEGFTRDDVATVGTVFGLAATLVGAVCGAWLIGRIGVGRALILTGITQMLSNLMYLTLVGGGRDLPMLFAQVGVENFTDGLADAAFLTYLSGLVNRSFSATQYALLSSLAAVPLRTLGASGGVLAASMGWTWFFLLTTAAALPAMAIMLFLLRRLPPPTPAERP